VIHFLRKYAGRMGKRIDDVAPSAMKVMTEHAWPSNMRELENFIERSVRSREGQLEPPLAELSGDGRPSPAIPHLRIPPPGARVHAERALNEHHSCRAMGHGALDAIGVLLPRRR